MGAGVAALVAGTIPKRIDRYCAIEGLGAMTQQPRDTPANLHSAIQDEIRRRQRSTKRVFATREDAVGARVRAGPIDPSSAEVLASRGLDAVDGGFRWRTDPMLRMASRMRLTEAQIHAFLQQIACPTLVIRAQDGFPVPEEYWQKRLALVQNLTLQTLPGRHHLHLDNPEPVAEMVARFLAAVS
ncbi:MAG: alpha/beta fold hydrolase, partial [Nannocystaceae bacterium]